MGLLDPIKRTAKSLKKGTKAVGLAGYASAFDVTKLKDPKKWAGDTVAGFKDDATKGLQIFGAAQKGDYGALTGSAIDSARGLGFHVSSKNAKAAAGLATSGAAIAASYKTGGVSGVVSGAGIVNAGLRSAGSKKQAKANASKSALQSHGSTDVAMKEKGARKGLIESILAIFGL